MHLENFHKQLESGQMAEDTPIYGVVRDGEGVANLFGEEGLRMGLPQVGQVKSQPPSAHEAPPPGLRVLAARGQTVSVWIWTREWAQAEVQVARLADLYERMPLDQAARDRLWDSSVLVFGAGSVGSRMAILLAEAGVGRFRMSDVDVFSIANVMRHEGDLTDLGRAKVQLVAERIHRINPDIHIESYPVDLFAEGNEVLLDRAFQEVHLAIGATDRLRCQLHINQKSFARGIPAIFPGCYELARAGEVLYVLPGRTSFCLECLRGGFSAPEQKTRMDYTNAVNPEDYEGEPGMHAAVELIVDVAVPYALGILLQGTDAELAKRIQPDANYVLIGGATAGGYYMFKRPFHIFWPKVLGPWEGCTTCRTATLTPEARDALEAQKKRLEQPDPEYDRFLTGG
jgi:molybdopterin/thiamine biosynthesis adenylyltransferase